MLLLSRQVWHSYALCLRGEVLFWWYRLLIRPCTLLILHVLGLYSAARFPALHLHCFTGCALAAFWLALTLPCFSLLSLPLGPCFALLILLER